MLLFLCLSFAFAIVTCTSATFGLSYYHVSIIFKSRLPTFHLWFLEAIARYLKRSSLSNVIVDLKKTEIKISSGTTINKMYPKVKVRVQAPDEKDQFDAKGDLLGERSSLMLLKVLESLSLLDHFSSGMSGKEYHIDSPPSIARIPKNYVPTSTPPSFSSSIGTGKSEKDFEEEDAKTNIKASSVMRPRAVLSSPDNDGMIGQINKLSRERPSVLKKNIGTGGQTTRTQSKVNTSCVKAKSPATTRKEPKETTDNKTCIKERRSTPDLTVPKQKATMRKVKPSSNGNLSSS